MLNPLNSHRRGIKHLNRKARGPWTLTVNKISVLYLYGMLVNATYQYHQDIWIMANELNTGVAKVYSPFQQECLEFQYGVLRIVDAGV